MVNALGAAICAGTIPTFLPSLLPGPTWYSPAHGDVKVRFLHYGTHNLNFHRFAHHIQIRELFEVKV